MRLHMLEVIKADDNLATLFNAYTKRLGFLETSVMPRENMREFRRLFIDAPAGLNKVEKRAAKDLLGTIPQFYHLDVLNNSLHQLHGSVIGAIALLNTFFGEYEGELTRYAVGNRIRVISEYGSDDDTDWRRDDERDETEAWKVVPKDDAASLKDYSLANDLATHFVGAEWRSEQIGVSQKDDFAYFTSLVGRAGDFDPFKALAAFTGREIPVYNQNQQGEMVEQTFGERTENNLKSELKNVRVKAWFEQTLDALNQAAALYTFATDTAGYRELLNQLLRIRDCQGLTEPTEPFNA